MLLPDALLARELPTIAAVVVGADGIGRRTFTNKAGTFGVTAAAWFSGVAVYVLATREKVESRLLTSYLATSTLFERIPTHLVSSFLMDTGAVPPDHLAAITEHYAVELPFLLEIL
jgi:translation initiation factor 2B subunit (eIF-2B alpha/beta/delta family)